MVSEGSQGQPVHTCGLHAFAGDLIGKLILSHLICLSGAVFFLGSPLVISHIPI